jgi:hypothetical protein
MCGETVGTAIFLRDGDGDLLAERGGDCALRELAAKRQERLRQRSGVRNDARKIGRDAPGRLERVERLRLLWGGGFGLDRFDASHDDVLSVLAGQLT